jgi:subtilisin family serine protease
MQVAHYPANYNVDNVLTVAATGITKNQVHACGWPSDGCVYLGSMSVGPPILKLRRAWQGADPWCSLSHPRPPLRWATALALQVFWDTRNPEYKPVFSNYGGKTVGTGCLLERFGASLNRLVCAMPCHCMPGSCGSSARDMLVLPLQVDLAAPGMDIVSTWAPASSMCQVTRWCCTACCAPLDCGTVHVDADGTGSHCGGGRERNESFPPHVQGAKSCYARISGTSAAVPFVAGTAALIASMPNAPKGKTAGMAIKSLILKHADKKVAP